MVFDASGNIIEVDDGGIYRRTNPANNTGDWFSIVTTQPGMSGTRGVPKKTLLRAAITL